LRIVDLLLLLAVPGLHLLHVALAALLGHHARAMHQHFLGLDEVLAVETPYPRMNVGVHPDRIARTCLDAQPTIDASQGVDLVAYRKLLHPRIRRFARFYVDALRGARRGAQVTRRASHRPVLAQREPMAAAIMVGVALAFFGILDRGEGAARLCQSEQMRGVDREIAGEMVARDREPLHDFREIDFLPEGHFLASLHVKTSAIFLSDGGFPPQWLARPRLADFQ